MVLVTAPKRCVQKQSRLMLLIGPCYVNQALFGACVFGAANLLPSHTTLYNSPARLVSLAPFYT